VSLTTVTQDPAGYAPEAGLLDEAGLLLPALEAPHFHNGVAGEEDLLEGEEGCLFHAPTAFRKGLVLCSGGW
jgi:hypothetical protein